MCARRGTAQGMPLPLRRLATQAPPFPLAPHPRAQRWTRALPGAHMRTRMRACMLMQCHDDELRPTSCSLLVSAEPKRRSCCAVACFLLAGASPHVPGVAAAAAAAAAFSCSAWRRRLRRLISFRPRSHFRSCGVPRSTPRHAQTAKSQLYLTPTASDTHTHPCASHEASTRLVPGQREAVGTVHIAWPTSRGQLRGKGAGTYCGCCCGVRWPRCNGVFKAPPAPSRVPLQAAAPLRSKLAA